MKAPKPPPAITLELACVRIPEAYQGPCHGEPIKRVFDGIYSWNGDVDWTWLDGDRVLLTCGEHIRLREKQQVTLREGVRIVAVGVVVRAVP